MFSIPLFKQTVKANGLLWAVFTAVMCVLLAQFAALDMTQFLLFLIQYGMLAMILPGIYILVSSNKLLASQVDRGSMAYVLSTPKRRSSIVITQIIYSVFSIAMMFVISAVIHLIVNHFIPLTLGEAGIEVPELMDVPLSAAMIFKINLSAMLVCLAMGGVCFMFSGIFNLSKYSIGFSGTFVGVSILANMMAMFGSLGVDALSNFKYVSICTLYDYNSILAGTDDWIIKSVLALAIAAVTYAVGGISFCKKDLPL